jgi:hypothetical protein
MCCLVRGRWYLSTEQWRNDDYREKATRRNPLPVLVRPPRISHEVTWDWTRRSVLRRQCLTTWAIPQPLLHTTYAVRQDAISPNVCEPNRRGTTERVAALVRIRIIAGSNLRPVTGWHNEVSRGFSQSPHHENTWIALKMMLQALVSTFFLIHYSPYDTIWPELLTTSVINHKSIPISLKAITIWDVTLCSLVDRYQCFGWIRCFLLHDGRTLSYKT